jgi:hypothetical protein
MPSEQQPATRERRVILEQLSPNRRLKVINDRDNEVRKIVDSAKALR